MLQVQNHQLMVEDPESGVLIPLCEEIYVSKKVENLFTGEISVEITLWSNGIEKHFTLERSALEKRCLLPFLLGQGLTLLDSADNVETLLEHLLESDMQAPTEYVHSKLGFCQIDGNTVFLADHPVGNIASQKATSCYNNHEVSAPHGTLASWLGLVHKEVLGHINLELALAIGVSAPIAYLLREHHVIEEIPIWGLIGRSSTGKTTALRLMASVFGSPEESVGLIKDLNATENAFFRTLSDSTGLPLIVDEATCRPNWDFAGMIYSLSKGLDKARCKGTGELRDRLRFSGSIIISGENSLFEQSTSNLGIYARLVELNLPWTDDASHARRISRGFRRNNGTAVVPLMTYLLKLNEEHSDVLEKLFDIELARLKTDIGSLSGVDERILNMYSTVLVAAIIAKNALGLNLNVKKLRKLFVKLHGLAPREATLAEKLYDAIMDAVSRNGSHFRPASSQGKNQAFTSDIWGEYTSRNGSTVIWITMETFENFAKAAKMGNFRQILPMMHEQGLLHKFSGDRYATRHQLPHVKVSCYCLNVYAPPKPKKAAKKPFNPLKSQKNLLLDDSNT